MTLGGMGTQPFASALLLWCTALTLGMSRSHRPFRSPPVMSCGSK
ncbi:hypothetical protein [Lysobacter gummosus]